MDLSKDFIKAKRPCTDGFRWFLRNHQHGSNYQPLLDELVKAGRVDDACWLLTQFGPTDAVLELDELCDEAIVYAGSIHVRGSIDVNGVIRVGREIRSGGGIRAGRAIAAGADIRTEGNVRCEGTISAGGDIRAAWSVEVQDSMRCSGDLRVNWGIFCNADLHADG
ncbi:MAG: hypothetical protein ACO1NO_01940, partial [Burkholderiaceae bacterium]